MKKLTIFIFCMLISASGFGQIKLNLFNQGKEYLNQGNYDLAIEKFDRVLDMDFRYAPAYFYKGKAYLEGKKEYNLAIENFTKALKHNTTYPEAYKYRAEAYSKINQPEKAEKDKKRLEHILSISEIDAVTVQENETAKEKARKYLLKGNGHVLNYMYDVAVHEFTKAIELLPDNPVLYYSRGEAYFNLQQYDLAIQDLNKALELKTEDFPSHSGALYPYPQNEDDFMGWFSEDSAHRLIGQAYYNKKEYDLAIEKFNKQIEKSKYGTLSYIDRGSAYLEKKEYDLAIADFTKAIEELPKFYEYYVYRAIAYEQKGEVEKAVADWRKHYDILYRKQLAESIAP
ncbi:MAG: tetratricopeptide repeat protein [Flavobacteriaceae bacterium]